MPVRIPRTYQPHINQPVKIIPESGLPKRNISESVIMQKIMDALKEADRDKDGCFNKDELNHALKDLGAYFPRWRANRAFGKVDANNDGQISGEEIDSLLEYLRSCGFGK